MAVNGKSSFLFLLIVGVAPIFNDFAEPCIAEIFANVWTLLPIGNRVNTPMESGRIPVGNRTSRNYVARCTMVFLLGSQFIEKTCVGAIISNTTIATAAHCTHLSKNHLSWPLSVFCSVGDLDSYIQESDEIEVNSNARGIIRHANYDPATRQFDIAKLVLDSPMTLGSNTSVDSIFMNENAAVLSNSSTLVTVTGWGSTYGGSPSMTTGVMKNRDSSACAVAYADDDQKYVFDPSAQLCFGGGSNIGPCFGDSGAPIVATVDGEQVLVGITSYFKRVNLNTGQNAKNTFFGKPKFQGGSAVLLACDYNAPSVATFIDTDIRNWLLT
ncbi:unnamed protein product [Notodromas monacha]|uniref:Peptidase S1 domain-containing protein n=1 Tax=Notodromas monacha TaxID=399045 RepID=A0A7R9BQQ0_9CRUS|nr:unnamed protein product [Notodromas monacha]CAG0918560.1 unnamed protein product [Notodromas monacha]